jgi:hypothetical protein
VQQQCDGVSEEKDHRRDPNPEVKVVAHSKRLERCAGSWIAKYLCRRACNGRDQQPLGREYYRYG